ncbi:MAG: sigma-70 family RNA polymerase sigma factor [Solirubrobacterales bacterium]|nr:sigma-70 family RNA polymerase sigma factor [Solirubrobacterales bacterium]
MSLEDEYDDQATVLYRKYAGRVQGFLISMGCDRGLAEEITDDAFLAARRRWAHVRILDEPEGYVFKIARNERSKRQKEHDSRAKDLHPDPHETLLAADDDVAQIVADRAVVRQALGELPASQREAVILRDAAGLSEAATAQAMGVSVGSVKRYTSEGRHKLRHLLAEFRRRQEGNGR